MQSNGVETTKMFPGFCFSASLEDIKTHGYVLTPGRFVGAEDELDDGVPFEEKFDALSTKLIKGTVSKLAGILQEKNSSTFYSGV